MQPKPKLAKHKLLKKQQSMFAIFPSDHNQQPQHQGLVARDMEAKKAELLAKIQSANRQLLNTAAENPSESEQGQKHADVNESVVCSIV